jgi:hypothetical protein
VLYFFSNRCAALDTTAERSVLISVSMVHAGS